MPLVTVLQLINVKSWYVDLLNFYFFCHDWAIEQHLVASVLKLAQILLISL